MKISFRKMAQTLTGFSTPLFGVSWNPSRLEVDVAGDLLTFLEDRRALYHPLEMETPEYVVRSVQAIRQRLTEDVQKIDRDSELADTLRTMRAACRDFVSMAGRDDLYGSFAHGVRGQAMLDFMAALMDLRAVFGTCIGQLCARYGLDIEEELASIVPSFQAAKLLESTREKDDTP